jgi:hypothetical protein
MYYKTLWDYSYDLRNRTIEIRHIKLDLKYKFTEFYIEHYLSEDFLQSKFRDSLSDLDIIQVTKVLSRHRWD